MRSRKRSKEGFLELILELALRVHVRRDVRRCCVVSETDEVDEVDETFFFVRLVAPPECDEGVTGPPGIWNLESVADCLFVVKSTIVIMYRVVACGIHIIKYIILIINNT